MTSIDGRGTTEAAWLPYLQSLSLPELDLPAPERVVVVAPHPDDEVLALGGLLALLAAAGTRVDVLAVTDGEASHPGGSVGPEQLALLRVEETALALDRLGTTGTVTRLALPDGGCEALEEPVAAALSLSQDDWLLGPWALDGHPDHEAVGRACVTAAARSGARLVEFPVWAWHWASPDHALPWARARKVMLPVSAQARKAHALQAFRTQVSPLGPLPQDAPVLPAHVLARFARPFEVVFT